MTREEWEGMCDGCGRCCLSKHPDAEGKPVYTRIACFLLDVKTRRCTDYENRKDRCPDCQTLCPTYVPNWLPTTCSYIRWKAGVPFASAEETEAAYPWKNIVSERDVPRFTSIEEYLLCKS